MADTRYLYKCDIIPTRSFDREDIKTFLASDKMQKYEGSVTKIDTGILVPLESEDVVHDFLADFADYVIDDGKESPFTTSIVDFEILDGKLAGNHYFIEACGGYSAVSQQHVKEAVNVDLDYIAGDYGEANDYWDDQPDYDEYHEEWEKATAYCHSFAESEMKKKSFDTCLDSFQQLAEDKGLSINDEVEEEEQVW